MRFFPFQRLRPLLLLAVLLLISAGQLLFAQAPTWQWAEGPGTGTGTSTAVDAAGNIYVAGSFTGTATFGGITLTSTGSADIFVAKRTAAGVWQWATRAGGGSNGAVSYDIAVDGSGGVVVTGNFSGPGIIFGATTLISAGGRDLFVAKLTPTGAWQWAASAQGTGTDISTSVAIDNSSGSVVVTGYFNGVDLTFGATTLLNVYSGFQGSNDLFVAKLTPAGTWQWATSAGGNDYDEGADVAIDGSGSVVVTGRFRSPTIAFGGTTLTNVYQGSQGSNDLFVAKLTPAGAWQWAISAGARYDDEGTSVAIDGSGSVVVTGYFNSPALTLGTIPLTGAVAYSFFVAKLSPAGTWQWATSARGNGGGNSNSVVVDGSGNVVVTGAFNGRALIVGATTLTSAGSTDLFVAKLTPTGAWQWVISAGGNGDDEGNSVAVDGSGSVVVTGSFNSPTIAFGATTLTNPSPADYAIFLARLGTANGLPEDPAAVSFTLTPNPVRTSVQLTGTPGATATLFDGLGRVVGTATLGPAGTATLAVGTLPAGLYLVRVGASRAQRLVVE